jgi:hypothetical protein
LKQDTRLPVAAEKLMDTLVLFVVCLLAELNVDTLAVQVVLSGVLVGMLLMLDARRQRQLAALRRLLKRAARLRR